MITDLASPIAQNEKDVLLQTDQSILTLEAPNVEEIARAIWQHQHDAFDSGALCYNAKWRDQFIPSKFRDEFVRDAHAVLTFLYKKHIEYQKTKI